MVKYGILGGGWAGLLAALEIKKKDPYSDVEILDKSVSSELGGLLRSEVIDGFTYDTGGPHILFSRNEDTLSQILAILGSNYKQMERKNYIHFEGKIIPYPFENGIFTLPATDRARIGVELIKNLVRLKNSPGWVPDSFHDWIYGIFGQEMGSRYLEPYNKKIWKRDLKEFDASWVFTPGRLPLPDVDDIIYSVSGIRTTGYKEQANFYYPKKGGIQSLYDSLYNKVEHEGIKLIPQICVEKIEQSSDERWTVNGSFEYDRLVSTLPPNQLLRSMKAPFEILEQTNRLDYNSVVVVGFAIDSAAPDQIALYVPQSDVIFHRYTWMSNLVSESPKGKSNLIVEVTTPKNQPVDIAEIEYRSVLGLKKLGIISGTSDIIHSKAWFHEYGYPVYTKGHVEFRMKIMEYLSKRKVISVGRWGSWHYWNTDKVLEAIKSYEYS